MLKIKGGNLLRGSINVNGSKNASLALIAASLLTKGKVTLNNVPNILDVNVFIHILKYLNVKVSFNNNCLTLDSTYIEYKSLLIEEIKKLRASSYLMGVFLSLFNKVEIYNPGGCSFSERPIDYHLNGFKTFGVDINEVNSSLFLEVNNIKNGYYYIPNISVGTTIDLLLFASLKDNTFIIDNIALESEVEEVIKFLKLLDIEIIKIRERTLLIKGKKELKKDINYTVMNDRIEAATLALFGATLGDKLTINGFNLLDNLYLLNIFNKLKVPYILKENKLIISKVKDFKGIDLETNPFPLLPTDIQPILTVFLSLGIDESSIKENIYPSRTSYVYELQKLNYNIKINNNKIIIKNSKKLKGNIVYGKDLRGSCALLLAALLIDDISYLEGYYFIKRGYEDLINRLNLLGANINEEETFNN